MQRWIQNVFHLGLKEIVSLSRDVYLFSLASLSILVATVPKLDASVRITVDTRVCDHVSAFG